MVRGAGDQVRQSAVARVPATKSGRTVAGSARPVAAVRQIRALASQVLRRRKWGVGNWHPDRSRWRRRSPLRRSALAANVCAGASGMPQSGAQASSPAGRALAARWPDRLCWRGQPCGPVSADGRFAVCAHRLGQGLQRSQYAGTPTGHPGTTSTPRDRLRCATRKSSCLNISISGTIRWWRDGTAPGYVWAAAYRHHNADPWRPALPRSVQRTAAAMNRSASASPVVCASRNMISIDRRRALTPGDA